jgi:hypothetical protein
MGVEMKQEVAAAPGTAGAGCLAELGWLASGFVLPLGSLSFYRQASRRRVGTAILFFFIFTMTIALVATLGLARNLFAAGQGVRETFESGSLPEIIIQDGVAQVQGHQPMIVVNDQSSNGQRMIVVIDTTGQFKEIDRTRFDQGFLLTRTELHILNQDGRYQAIPLSEIQTMFDANPIVINAETASRGWNIFAAVFTVVAFMGLVLWESFVRLMFLAMIALVFWGLVSTIRPNTGFGPILISGLYALVPAVYLRYMLRQAGIAFPGLETFLLLAAWVVGLLASFSEADFFKTEGPPRLWRALIGLPMLIVLAASVVFDFNYEKSIVAGLVLLTLLALAAVGLYFRFRKVPGAPAPPPASAA